MKALIKDSREISFSSKDQRIWFTSDTHFWHYNIIQYCSRPFESSEEMNKALIENWRSRVAEDDIIFHLGDFAHCGSSKMNDILHALTGRIFLILGNHDWKNMRAGYDWRFEHMTQQMCIKIDGRKVYLNHFPYLCYTGTYKGNEDAVYQLFGHVHSGPRNDTAKDNSRLSMLFPYQYDVGVDNNGYAPISWEEVQEKIAQQIKRAE